MILLQKYKNMTLPAKAGIWFLVCNFLQKGITVLTTPIFTRILNTSEYGEVSVFYSWQDVFSIFITMGLASSVYSRGLVQHEKSKDEYTSVLMSLATITSVISFVIYIIFWRFINGITGMSTFFIVLIYIYTFFNTSIEFWHQRKRVIYHYIPVVLITLILATLKPVCAMLAIYFNPNNKVPARIVADVIVTMAIGMPIYISLMLKGRHFLEKKIWKESFIFVLLLIPHYLSQRVLSQSDRIMIGKMIGTSEAGIYSLAYSVGMLLMLLNNALDSTVAPWIYRKLRDKDYKSIKNINQSLIILYSLCVICFSLVAPELVQVFASSDYYDAIYIIPIISVGSFFVYLYVQFIYFEYYIGKTFFISITTLLCAILNFLLNYLCIPVFGYTAAAYTTLLCYVLYAIGHYFTMQYLNNKYLGVKKIYNNGILISVGMSNIIVGVVMPYFYHYQWQRLFVASVMIFITVQYVIKLYKNFCIKNNGKRV